MDPALRSVRAAISSGVAASTCGSSTAPEACLDVIAVDTGPGHPPATSMHGENPTNLSRLPGDRLPIWDRRGVFIEPRR